MNNRDNCVTRLIAAGISQDDAWTLRRIAMTLHRWHELECGDSNDYASWTITRGHKNGGEFIYDENGSPFEERHVHSENKPRYTAIADREKGALARLKTIMKRYPGFASYVQGDPRGAALYILPPSVLATVAKDVAPTMRDTLDLSAVYDHGIAVYK